MPQLMPHVSRGYLESLISLDHHYVVSTTQLIERLTGLAV